jgi:hypothetical protein
VSADGNTNIRILGINYYRSIGEFGDKALGEEFTLSGERLTEFSADGNEFRPTAVTVVAPNIRSLKINKVQTIVSKLTLTNQWRLLDVNLQDTSIPNVELPEAATTISVLLGAALQTLVMKYMERVEEFDLQGVANLTSIEVVQSGDVVMHKIYEKLDEIN